MPLAWDTVSDLAKLSALAYGKTRDDQTATIETLLTGTGWSAVAPQTLIVAGLPATRSDGSSSFDAQGFFQAEPVVLFPELAPWSLDVAKAFVAAKAGQVAIVFRGTDGPFDLALDVTGFFSGAFAVYADLFQPLIDAVKRLVSPPLPGFGEESAPALSLASNVSMLVQGDPQAIDLLGADVLTTGHSLGGGVAEYWWGKSVGTVAGGAGFGSPGPYLLPQLGSDAFVHVARDDDIIGDLLFHKGISVVIDDDEFLIPFIGGASHSHWRYADQVEATASSTSLQFLPVVDDLRVRFLDEQGASILASAPTHGYVGSENNDVINGTSSFDSVVADGRGGDDTITGSSIDDLISGGPGVDRLNGRDGRDALFGGDGDDILDGAQLPDILVGGADNDRLVGGDGGDFLAGGPGADVLEGGTGSDTAVYDFITFNGVLVADESNVGVFVDLALGVASGGDAQGDTLTSIENLAGSVFNDVFAGNELANVLSGEGGDDTLRGGAGADTLDGGAGFDLVSYTFSSLGIVIDLAARVAGGGHATGDTLAGVEGVLGSPFTDALSGDAQNNQLIGAAGADTLIGAGGADILSGEGDGDFLVGGDGGDVLDGGEGFDVAAWFNETAGLTLNLTNQALNAGSAAGDMVANSEVFYLTDFVDTFVGFAGAFIYGFGGDDSITGSSASDIIDGGDGGDTIDAGAGFDYVSYYTSPQGVRVDLVNPASNTGFAQGDVLTSADAFILTAQNDVFIGLDAVQNIAFGYEGDDTLTGGFNTNNWLFGGAGDDRMVGGGVGDLFVGDIGADRIALATSAPIAGSSVFGFEVGTDQIEISRATFGLSAGYTLSPTTFVGGTAPVATSTQGTFFYYADSGLFYFDPDGTGASSAHLLMQFAGAPALSASDLILI